MTTRLLVPLDGSDKDMRAVQVADAFARLVAGRIHFVRVLETPATLVSAGLAVIGAVPESGADQRAGVDASLHAIASRLSSGSSRDVQWEVIDGVDVAAELLRRAEQMADIIILSSRAPGTLERAFLGSVADEIVRKSSRPVVVVPPGAHYAPEKEIAFSRALAPLDGSNASRSALDRLLEVVPAGHLEYVLMRVVQRESSGGYQMPEPVPTAQVRGGGPSSDAPVLHVQAEHAERHLREAADQLRFRGERVRVRVVELGDPASAIIAAVRAELVDLIVMSTHGAGGLRRVLHGSVANRVARESEVPVFLVRPDASVAA